MPRLRETPSDRRVAFAFAERWRSIIMKSWWAGVTLVALAGTGTRCDCAPFRARLADLRIGVAADEGGPMTPKPSADSAKFVACELGYSNLPEKSKVGVVWSFYASLGSTMPYVRTDGEVREVAGNGDITARVEARHMDGVYECSWHVDSTSRVENATPSARIVIGHPPP